MIVAATELFVQQVMTVKERSIYAPGQASIQVCNFRLYIDYGEGFSPGMNQGQTIYKLPNGFEPSTSMSMPCLINSTVLRPLVKLDP